MLPPACAEMVKRIVAALRVWKATRGLLPEVGPGSQQGQDERVIKRMQAMRMDGATYRAIGAVTGHGPMSVMRILERVERTVSARSAS